MVTLEDSIVIPSERRGVILRKASFGCLRGIPALNITRGCLFRCTYCYARGYPEAPKSGQVLLYANLATRIEYELSRKRVLPPWVVINTASDCFQPHPDILRIAFRTMAVLLESGVGISFLTKGEIPPSFLDLFARYPGRVLAQVGLVSLAESYQKTYEPLAATPSQRLRSIDRLAEIGILPEIRMDPLIPFQTDTEAEITPLFRELKHRGVWRVSLSYLHLRPAIQEQLAQELPPLHRKLIDACYGQQHWTSLGSSSRSKLLPRTFREKGYRRVRALAEAFGIQALVCQCKNPDLRADLCSSGRIAQRLENHQPQQPSLFRC